MKTRIRGGLCSVAVLSAALAAGCSEAGSAQPAPQSGGAPQPSASSMPGSSTVPGPGDNTELAALKACDLGSEQEFAEFRVTRPGEDKGARFGATSSCVWIGRSVGERATALGISIRPSQGLAEVNVTAGQVSDGKVGERTAKQLAGGTGGSCELFVEMGPTARVDLSASGAIEVPEACDLVGKLAEIVEPKLPKEGE
ncbi:hypothetical protein CFN78_10270 [Amycolatopsis antarctica]|uniref:DUF3558 domain-containing protein n=1 Tax=Amycolatopsis antarctica TaxID=1854586 RepID=A0A263D432_9PSEU|nr:DUF3558 family protein [Amycolatopsis antarctica]OZM73242.1 hypothetical protein CFN78_10270 [Amycolatopsis antarctica]